MRSTIRGEANVSLVFVALSHSIGDLNVQRRAAVSRLGPAEWLGARHSVSAMGLKSGQWEMAG